MKFRKLLGVSLLCLPMFNIALCTQTKPKATASKKSFNLLKIISGLFKSTEKLSLKSTIESKNNTETSSDCVTSPKVLAISFEQEESSPLKSKNSMSAEQLSLKRESSFERLSKVQSVSSQSTEDQFNSLRKALQEREKKKPITYTQLTNVLAEQGLEPLLPEDYARPILSDPKLHTTPCSSKPNSQPGSAKTSPFNSGRGCGEDLSKIVTREFTTEVKQ